MKLTKKYIGYLFRFESLVRLLEFYVLVLSIIALLITIRVYDINVRPEWKILKPIFFFDSQKIAKILRNPIYSPIVDKSELLKSIINENSPWVNSILTYFIDYDEKAGIEHEFAAFDFIKPKNKTEEISGYITYDEWYLMGIRDTFKHLQVIRNDLKASRTDDHKIKDLKLLLSKAMFFDSDTLKKADTSVSVAKELSAFSKVSSNPFEEIVKIDPYDEQFLGANLFANTTIYTCISISNPSNQAIENLNVVISDVWNLGNFSVFGWTLSGNVIDIRKSSTSVQFTIDRLESGNSIEVLLKGKRLVRQNDMRLNYAGISYIDKYQVISLLVIIALLVWFIHFILWYKFDKLLR